MLRAPFGRVSSGIPRRFGNGPVLPRGPAGAAERWRGRRRPGIAEKASLGGEACRLFAEEADGVQHILHIVCEKV